MNLLATALPALQRAIDRIERARERWVYPMRVLDAWNDPADIRVAFEGWTGVDLSVRWQDRNLDGEVGTRTFTIPLTLRPHEALRLAGALAGGAALHQVGAVVRAFEERLQARFQ